jgi:hypothetical protein
MCNTTVMKFVRNFGNIKFIINNQFFGPFNFMYNNKLLNGRACNLRKKIRNLGIIKL